MIVLFFLLPVTGAKVGILLKSPLMDIANLALEIDLYCYLCGRDLVSSFVFRVSRLAHSVASSLRQLSFGGHSIVSCFEFRVSGWCQTIIWYTRKLS